MNAFTERSLLDLTSFIVDNRGRTCPTANDGIPLIATNCLKAGSREVVFENLRYVDDETYSTWFRSHPKPGDILFVCKGSPGRVAVVPDPVSFCIAQDMVALRAANDVWPGYLYYRILAPDVQFGIQNMHVGTMIPHFKKGDFGNLAIRVHHDVGEQRAIAEVLGALDDKIAANKRLITCAESLMIAYASEATRSTKIGSLASHSTRSLSPEEFHKTVAHYSLPAFDSGALPVTEEARSIKSNKFIIDSPSVLISKLNPRIPRLWNIVEPTGIQSVASTEFVVLVPRSNSTSVLWALLAQPAVSIYISSKVAGTSGSHQRVKPLEILTTRVGDPESLDKVVRDLIDSLGRRINGARGESQVLAKTRDELLPLLMSGKLRVKDAEKKVEEII